MGKAFDHAWDVLKESEIPDEEPDEEVPKFQTKNPLYDVYSGSRGFSPTQNLRWGGRGDIDPTLREALERFHQSQSEHPMDIHSSPPVKPLSHLDPPYMEGPSFGNPIPEKFSDLRSTTEGRNEPEPKEPLGQGLANKNLQNRAKKNLDEEKESRAAEKDKSDGDNDE
jgi:hypothetical protein